MRREALYPFLPAVLAAVTDAATAAIVRAQQPDYPGRFIAYQIVMFGAALLASSMDLPWPAARRRNFVFTASSRRRIVMLAIHQ
jgi:hypothetical protein